MLMFVLEGFGITLELSNLLGKNGIFAFMCL